MVRGRVVIQDLFTIRLNSLYSGPPQALFPMGGGIRGAMGWPSHLMVPRACTLYSDGFLDSAGMLVTRTLVLCVLEVDYAKTLSLSEVKTRLPELVSGVQEREEEVVVTKSDHTAALSSTSMSVRA